MSHKNYKVLTFNFPIWGYQNGCFYVPLLNHFPSYLAFCGPLKRFYLLRQLCYGSHDRCKVLNETTVELNHAIKQLNLLWINWYMHLHYSL